MKTYEIAYVTTHKFPNGGWKYISITAASEENALKIVEAIGGKDVIITDKISYLI